jgi:8-oxo-dGTP pyrophosphatase MutT (NUDIX family)
MDSKQPSLTEKAPVQVAIAILYRQNQYLMQLRDDVPGIVYPGCWGLFGGHIEPGEPPEIAVRRELAEEISFVAGSLFEFARYRDHRAVRHVFHGPLTIPPNELTLKEGWDLALLTPSAIRAGQHYSAQAQQTRLLGEIHQKILLDFINSQNRELK